MFNSEDIEIFEKLRDKFNLIEDNFNSNHRRCHHPHTDVIGTVIIIFDDECGVNIADHVFDGKYGPAEYSGLRKYVTYEAAEKQIEKILKETDDILEHRKMCIKFRKINAIKHAGDSWEIA